MQMRLAWMHDRLNEVAGVEPEHHLEAEREQTEGSMFMSSAHSRITFGLVMAS
jgi:hypothetical protein